MDNIKQEFPTLVNLPELAYFDSAASTQTHTSVLQAMNHYYEFERCNVHRGDYEISRLASDKLDIAREQVAELVNVKPENIIFTTGATEGMNIIADWYKSVSTVIITELEHSANVMPWLAQGRTTQNGRLKVLPTDIDGSIDLHEAEKIISANPGSLVSIIATSNVTAHDTPWGSIANIAKQYGCTVALDACQTVGSHELAFTDWIDFAVFSGHKMYGPVGVGVLVCNTDVNKLRSVRLGGGAVRHYDFEGNIVFNDGPEKHEPGTPNIAGIIGLGVAAEWIKYIGYKEINKRLNTVERYLIDAGLYDIKHLTPVHRQFDLAGLNKSTLNIASFTSQKIHPSDIGALLGTRDVAVRAGKLCAHHIVNKLSDKGVLRISWGIYNTKEDCVKLVDELCKATNRLAS